MSAAPLQTQALQPQPSGGVSFAQARRGVNDALESEADRVAGLALAGKANPRAPAAPPGVPRASHPHGALPTSVARALRHHGTPLEPGLRRDMEARFGHDFARVRVHCDPPAAESARSIGAAAYTVGHDVAFGRGRYAPQTHEGRHLIAHELTHVAQQSGMRSSALPISAAPPSLMCSEDDDSWFPSAADVTDPFKAIALVNRLSAIPFLGSTIRDALVASASKKVVALFDLDPAFLAQVKDVYDDPEKYLEQLRDAVQPYIETIPAYAQAEAEQRLADLNLFGEPLARVMRTIGVQLQGLGANWWPILRQTVMQQIMLWDWSLEAASLEELDAKYRNGTLGTVEYGLQVLQVVLGGLDRVLGAIGIGLWIVSFVGGTGVGTAGGGAVGSLAAGAGAAPGAAAGGGTGATAGGTIGAGAFELLGVISDVTSLGAQAAVLATAVADLAIGEDNEAATEEDYQLIASTLISIGILAALFVLGSIGAAVAKKLANRLREIAPRSIKALPAAVTPKIAAGPEVRVHVPRDDLVAMPRPDLGEGVDLMVPPEYLEQVVQPAPPRPREVIDAAPAAVPERSPLLLTDRGAPSQPAHEPADAEPPLVTTKEITDVDLQVEELLGGGAARDAIEHPAGTALVRYEGERAPAAAPTPTPIRTPAAAALRARNEARVSFRHSMSSGVMQEAGLNSEHLLPASVIERDPLAIAFDFKESTSPTIMIDEKLHQAGMTYGKGIEAVIYDYDNPLEMVDAAIANYARLLDEPRFAHLDKAKYMEGFAELREVYIGQFPDVFDPTRSEWWE